MWFKNLKHDGNKPLEERVSHHVDPDGLIEVFIDGETLGHFDPKANYEIDKSTGKWIEVPKPSEPTLPPAAKR